MAKTLFYDEKCYELAGWFLSDVPELANDAARRQLAAEIQSAIDAARRQLAAEIQSAIEAEINWMKNHGVDPE